jgi:hypothetical protein
VADAGSEVERAGYCEHCPLRGRSMEPHIASQGMKKIEEMIAVRILWERNPGGPDYPEVTECTTCNCDVAAANVVSENRTSI